MHTPTPQSRPRPEPWHCPRCREVYSLPAGSLLDADCCHCEREGQRVRLVRGNPPAVSTGDAELLEPWATMESAPVPGEWDGGDVNDLAGEVW